MSDEIIDRTARAEMAQHNALCAERYGSLWTAVRELRDEMRSRDAIQHTRFNTISNRMWLAVAGIAASAIIGICSMAFYMIAKGLR